MWDGFEIEHRGQEPEDRKQDVEFNQNSVLPNTQHSRTNILSGHTDAVWSVAFSPDSRTIASGSLDGTVRLWNRLNGQCLRILQHHQSGVWSVAFAPNSDVSRFDRQLLASGSQDQTIQLWEIVLNDAGSENNPNNSSDLSVHLLKTLEGHISWIRCIVFSPSGEFSPAAVLMEL